MTTDLFVTWRRQKKRLSNGNYDYVSSDVDILIKRCSKVCDVDISVKRCKIVGNVSYGDENMFLGYKQKIYFSIRDFKQLKQQKDEFIITDTATACGHPWSLILYPRGCAESVNSCVKKQNLVPSKS